MRPVESRKGTRPAAHRLAATFRSSQRRWSAQRALVSRGHVLGVFLVRLRTRGEEYRTKRRQSNRGGPASSVQRQRCGFDSSHVPLSASTVKWSVAVEDFAPVTATREADLIIVPRQRR